MGRGSCWCVYSDVGREVPWGYLHSIGASGSSLLIFCIHVRSGPIYWGGYLPCKKYYKEIVFYM